MKTTYLSLKYQVSSVHGVTYSGAEDTKNTLAIGRVKEMKFEKFK